MTDEREGTCQEELEEGRNSTSRRKKKRVIVVEGQDAGVAGSASQAHVGAPQTRMTSNDDSITVVGCSYPSHENAIMLDSGAQVGTMSCRQTDQHYCQLTP